MLTSLAIFHATASLPLLLQRTCVTIASATERHRAALSRFKIRYIPACCAAAFLASTLHAAQSDFVSLYPNKPIRFIIPFSPGAGTDTTGRTIAVKLSEKWGQQVIVDNRAGAAGTIGVGYTAAANPDGYTICLISASHSINSATNPKLPYDLTKDLQAITQATSLFFVLYHHPSLPVKSVKDLIAYAKANPAKVNFGSSGTGGITHFAGEMFAHMAEIKMVHVPYKGAASVVPGMLAGEVQIAFSTLFGVRPQVQAGRLRWLAISANKRAPAAPELPTVAESGLPGYAVDQWYGVVTSAKVPAPIVSKLQAAIAEALQAPDVAQRLAADGSTPVGSTSGQFAAHIKSEIVKWKKLVREANLTLH